ncbi:hypothetical protein [Candidatus Merdisoma sp. JLR.KK006]|uniref:hypothetical protein n=1 Tax=Candidatus Merdisoma sp. JLR.KK006 TaxID=3112626 RepID=UPI002FF361A9
MKGIAWLKGGLLGLVFMLAGCGQSTEIMDGTLGDGMRVPGTMEVLEQFKIDNRGRRVLIFKFRTEFMIMR